MRFRGDFYRENFFNTAGDIAVPQTSPVPTTDPTLPPVLEPPVLEPSLDPGTSVPPSNPLPELQDQATNDIATTDGNTDAVPTYTLSEITSLIGTVRPPTTYPYLLSHPTLVGQNILVTENGGTLVIDDGTPTIDLTGGGGGGGGALMLDEEEEIGGKLAQPKKPKNTIIWLIVGAVVLYFGYKYLVKKNN
jgi:hypothetical protein